MLTVAVAKARYADAVPGLYHIYHHIKNGTEPAAVLFRAWYVPYMGVINEARRASATGPVPGQR
jgi:hypothetical protein